MPSIQDLFTPNRAWAAQMEAEPAGEVFVHRNVANMVVLSDPTELDIFYRAAVDRVWDY